MLGRRRQTAGAASAHRKPRRGPSTLRSPHIAWRQGPGRPHNGHTSYIDMTYYRRDPNWWQPLFAAVPACPSDAGLVFAGLGIDSNLVALVDEGGDLNHQAGLEGRGLHLRTGGSPFDAGHGFLHDQIDGRRQLDSHRLDVVELDADQHLCDEVVLRVAERFGGDVDLVVGRRIHEVVVVAVVVEILHLALVERRALNVLFRAELLVGEGARANVPHAHLDVRALVAGREVVQLENPEQVVPDLDQIPLPESSRLQV